MAQRVVTLLTCDLHDDDTEGAETLQFAFDGIDYEIDVCAQHRDDVQARMRDLISHARRASRGRRARLGVASAGRGRGRGGSGYSRDELGTIRAWARAQGYQVSDRGRIPSEVLEAYAQS